MILQCTVREGRRSPRTSEAPSWQHAPTRPAPQGRRHPIIDPKFTRQRTPQMSPTAPPGEPHQNNACHPERTGPRTSFSSGVVSRRICFCFLISPFAEKKQKLPFSKEFHMTQKGYFRTQI